MEPTNKDDNTNKSDSTKKWHVISSAFVLLFITILLIWSILKPFPFSTPQVLLVGLMVFISLSFVFDKLALGKFLSVERTVKELSNKQQAFHSEIKEEQHQLKQDIMSLVLSSVTNVRQDANQATRNHLNVVVTSAKPEEHEQDENLDNRESQQVASTVREPDVDYQLTPAEHAPVQAEVQQTDLGITMAGPVPSVGQNERIRRMNIYELPAINAAAKKRGIDLGSIDYDIKLDVPSSMIASSDKLYFTAFAQTNAGMFFFEVLLVRPFLGNMFRDRVTRLLTGLAIYANNSVPVKLVLILVESDRPERSNYRDMERMYQRLYQMFQPAIATGLLEMETFGPGNFSSDAETDRGRE